MRILETFTTYQGTGHLSGTLQFFVRFAGCSVKCGLRSVCDEPGALPVGGGEEKTTLEIMRGFESARYQRGVRWMHITGGEPCDQPDGLQELAMTARRAGVKVHLQTSGHVPVPIQWDWLTVSPKADEPGKLEQRFGQELIVVLNGQTDEHLRSLLQGTKFWVYYLQPRYKDGEPENIEATMGALERLNRRGMDWSLACQAHKALSFR